MKILIQSLAIPLGIFIGLLALARFTDARFDYLPVDKLIRLEKPVQSKVYLVNVWATWCKPCLEELPEMNELAGHFKPEELKVIAFCQVDTGRKEMQKYNRFVTEHPQYSNLIFAENQDSQTLLSSRLAEFHLSPDSGFGVPCTFLVRDNRIKKVWKGYSKEQMKEMETSVKALLEEGK